MQYEGDKIMQAKETRYKNIVFRSRLEARWAVFFDALNIQWKYELEGYVLKNGMSYLPDFYLENVGGHIGNGKKSGIFVEIKGNLTDYDKTKISGFEEPIIVLGDIPNSVSLWKDIYKEHAEAENYIFSEYTVDKYMGPIWFATCGSGIKLLRRNEYTAKGFINWCESACAKAKNYKFEFSNNTSDTYSYRENNYTNNNFYSGADYYNQFMDGIFKAFDPNERAKKEAENKRRYEEELRCIPKISVQRVKDILVSEPGITEYAIANRIRICALKLEIPLESSFRIFKDIPNKRLMISYEYYMKSVQYSFDKIGENLFYIDLTVNGNTNRSSEDIEYNKLYSVINNIFDLFKEEIKFERGSREGYNQFIEKKKRRLELVLDTIKKEELEKKTKIENELLDVQERERFELFNNQLTIGEFFMCLKSEILKDNDNKYAEELSTMRLADGVNFEDKFGLGSFMLVKDFEEIIIRLNHFYTMTGVNKKNYSNNDKRDLICFNCMYEDLLDKSAMMKKQSELINYISGPLSRVENMFRIKQSQLEKQ